MIMMTLRMCLRSPGILIGAMVMAFVISPKLAAIFIIVLPVLAVLIVVIMRRAFPQFRTLQENWMHSIPVFRKDWWVSG